MKTQNITVQDLLSDKIVVITGTELKSFFQQYSSDEKDDRQKSDHESYGLPRFVTGLKSLAATLNVSLSTVSRWKAKGLLDTVTFQDGKSVIFDVYGVLDLLRVSNQKGKYSQQKYNKKKQ